MPGMDLAAERKSYEEQFAQMASELADVDFFVDELVTEEKQATQLQEQLKTADGILLIHLSMGVTPLLRAILAAGRPTALFAAPYSGHEWTSFGALMRQPEGKLLDCMLTADRGQLAAAIRPFRAIHHLRQAKIVDVTTRDVKVPYVTAVSEKFGTQVIQATKQQMLEVYESIPDADAEAETKRWIEGAEKVVEPSREDVFKSCKLALASERLLDQLDATMITVDCYGTMWRQLPAYPCIGHARLNNMGLGGMCESDLKSCMSQILLQGLCGKPGFVNDPTFDTSRNAIILAHCMGTPKMDGPRGESAPYRLRTIMERQEGCVCQVRMRVGQRATTAQLVEPDKLLYFTGQIIEAPDSPRGCRTQATVRVDGDSEKLWKNWSAGLHRVTCYGDLTRDLERFCRYTGTNLVNEA
jgi:L-fucose isomerase-like protein